jgi:large subunit ribosomal protein L25
MSSCARVVLRRSLTYAGRRSTGPSAASSLSKIRAAFSSNAAAKDPSQFVSGLSPDDANDPLVKEFLQANMEGDGDSGKYIFTLEEIKELGLTEADFQKPEGERDYDTPKIDTGLGTEAQQTLNIRVLHSYKRVVDGTNACKRLRYEDMIPGLVYGSDPTAGILSKDPSSKTLISTPWFELQRELDRFHRKFESRVYDLTVFESEDDTEGTIHRVTPRDVQRHPVQGGVFCTNFLRYFPGRPLKIPIVYINQEESPALKRDGYIVPVNKYVECVVEEGVPIPEKLELECTGVQLKEVLRLDRIEFPDGVRLSKRVNPDKFIIGPVRGGRGAATETAEDGDVAGAPAE